MSVDYEKPTGDVLWPRLEVGATPPLTFPGYTLPGLRLAAGKAEKCGLGSESQMCGCDIVTVEGGVGV